MLVRRLYILTMEGSRFALGWSTGKIRINSGGLMGVAVSRVLVSYSSKDRDFVVRLAEDLQKAGHDVWLDTWKITGRKPYWSEIQEGIESCSHFIFAVSPDSISEDGGAII